MSKRRGALEFIAFSEIIILLLGVVAFSTVLSEISFVSAQETLGPPAPGELPVPPQSEVFNFDNTKIDRGSGSGLSGLLGSSQTGSPTNRIAVAGKITEGSSFILQKKEIFWKDVASSQTSAGGGLDIIGKDGSVLGTVPKEKASEFLGQANSKGVSFAKPDTTDVLGAQVAVGGLAHLFNGLIWSAAVVGAIQVVAPLLGADKKLTNTLSIAAVAGIMTYQGISSLGPSGFGAISNLQNPLLANAGLIGIGVAAVTFVLLYKNEKKKVLEFQCLPYEPPLGGQKCEECNNGELPCSEYKCRSLGQACEIVNPGTNDEKCVWISKDDVKSPIITPWPEALTKDHQYTNHETRPPSLGTKIIKGGSANGCIQPFTRLQFGVTTDEPAQCKIDTSFNKSFDDMQFFFGETNLLATNHTQQLRLPSPDSIKDVAGEDLVVGSDGKYDFYVRCRDANGNENVDAYAFSFCVDPTPDTTPPIIEDSSIKSGSPVSAGTDNVSLSVFVNEPSECKWSIQDKAYSDMENSLSCSTKIYQQNARQLYECTTNLLGIKDRTKNKFYFRCKDQPGKQEADRNVNVQSFELDLLGSQELNIVDISPKNTTLFDSSDSVKVDLQVETSNGANEGDAVCYFSPDGNEGSYVAMFETGTFVHKQTLQLAEGDYTYYIRCIDLGGNTDSETISFNVKTDTVAPFITRLYKEGVDALKIVTSEKSECTYSLNSCNFNIVEGIAMKTLNADKGVVHFAEWKPGQTYYVKCQDDFGNQPAPNQCTLQISASSLG